MANAYLAEQSGLRSVCDPDAVAGALWRSTFLSPTSAAAVHSARTCEAPLGGQAAEPLVPEPLDEPDEEEPEELDEVDGDAAGVEEVFEEELSFEDELEEPLTLDDEPERLSVR